MSDNFNDIINIKYPFPEKLSPKHPPMTISDRAKIFGSFAALKGHSDEIDNKRLDVEDYVNNKETLREEFFD